MKLPIRLLLVNLTCLSTLWLPACTGPIVEQASFPRDPRGVRFGDLLGPFNGRVVDADSDKPIEGALVWASWSFARGVGSPAPLESRVVSVRTGPDGDYRIRRPAELPGGSSTRLGALSVVVYKRGYVAYRHDWRFGAKVRPRRDFSQLYNVVRLSRWSSEHSHARHLLFIGGSGVLRAASAAEREAAARELDAPAREGAREEGEQGPAPMRRSDAQRLLDPSDVRAVTGFAGNLRGAPLQSAGDAESSWHLRAVERPERYDLALRLWRLRGADLVKKLAELRASLPGSQERGAAAKGAFFVKQGEILGFAFADEERGALVLLTCGSGQCSDEATLSKLVARVRARLKSIAPAEEESSK